MPETAVVIPYYQQEPGLLPKAIRSVLAQQDAGSLVILVCDDSSPSPIEAELELLTPAERLAIVVVKQPNAGCGFSRNGAMTALPPDVHWIAFIDSDDAWDPTHLARARAALTAGYDLFFADARRAHEVLTTFQAAGFQSNRHQPITTHSGLYGFTGDFITQLVEQPPIPISSVVIRASLLGDLRFQKLAFEDILFFFAAARRGARFAFSETMHVLYGRGDITVADSWASQRELKNCCSYQRTFKQVWRETALSPDHRRSMRKRFANNRSAFCRIMLGLLRRGEAPARSVVLEFLALDPRLVLSFGTVLAVSAARLLTQGRSPAG